MCANSCPVTTCELCINDRSLPENPVPTDPQRIQTVFLAASEIRDPVEHLVERPEDDPKPAPAEDLEDLIVPDPAERVGAGGRLQE